MLFFTAATSRLRRPGQSPSDLIRKQFSWMPSIYCMSPSGNLNFIISDDWSTYFRYQLLPNCIVLNLSVGAQIQFIRGSTSLPTGSNLALVMVTACFSKRFTHSILEGHDIVLLIQVYLLYLHARSSLLSFLPPSCVECPTCYMNYYELDKGGCMHFVP